MHFMEHIQGNLYRVEGVDRNYREHPIEVAGSTLESILGLGMMYEDFGYEELSDMPEMVTMLEAGLMSQNMSRRSSGQYGAQFYNMRMNYHEAIREEEIAVTQAQTQELMGENSRVRQRASSSNEESVRDVRQKPGQQY
eukprot:3052625-Heterocapsa_arctica.AAC.1